MKPVREKWWDTCVKKFTAPFYQTEDQAKNATESTSHNRVKVKKGQFAGYFIWGDRVKIISGNIASDDIVKVSGRGTESWIRSKHLKGKPLLELYVIDVGQGDGLLLISPEGHHIMVDGGNTRSRQNGGKNAADFVDWKFFNDYLKKSERTDADKTVVKLDAMIASHNDIDHFGGLLDLLDFKSKKNAAELDCSKVLVENFYHAGLSWWYDGKDSNGRAKRTLSTPDSGFYTKLLDDRTSAENATEKLNSPDKHTLSGSWGKCIKAAVKSRKPSNSNQKTNIERLSADIDWLPHFANTDTDSEISIKVLGPISEMIGGKPGLKVFKDGDSKNTNGHSVVLKVNYGKRSLLLTGDLNTHSQNYIMASYANDFEKEWASDVAKGCHHGSHDVSYKFLNGLQPVATIISSGDAETHDHPRPTIVAASALTGRKLWDSTGESLITPLIYMTEISRSYDLKRIEELHEFSTKQPEFTSAKPKGDEVHNTIAEKSRFRTFLKKPGSASKQSDWPRMDKTTTVRGLRYGLVNVRTDGETLFFASMEEQGKDWSVTVLTDQQISDAKQ